VSSEELGDLKTDRCSHCGLRIADALIADCGLIHFYRLWRARSVFVFGWMPTGCNPFTPGRHCKKVVQFQSNDCGTPAGRPSDDLCAVRAPREMPRPSLRARIEKPNASVCDRIMAVRLNAFETVAGTARKPNIFFLIRAATRGRLDMLNF